MSEALSHDCGGSGSTLPLSRIVYRSRAARPLDMPALQSLVDGAQSRNRKESITGLMLYDDSRFFQWLEGPPVGVARIMHSIQRDTRHKDLEILADQTAEKRSFGGWSMKLAGRDLPGSAALDVLEPPRALVEGLRARPEAAPKLLVALVPVPQSRHARTNWDIGAPLPGRMTEILRSVMLSTVIPALVRQMDPAQLGPLAHPRAGELADLLIGPDAEAALALIEELQAGQDAHPLYAPLFEPAARHLGDLWTDDACSEFDVTLGLSRLQTAIRALSPGLRRRMPVSAPPVVLIAPEPGEIHQLGAALDSDVLWRAGWAPHDATPQTDQALQDLLAATWFDVLDLSLSTAFRREDRIGRVGLTIANARSASRNPALVVIVGGRLFVEDRGAGAEVGADFASRSADRVDRSIMDSLHAAEARPKVVTGPAPSAPRSARGIH